MSYPTTALDRAVDVAIARENEDPRGLPADVMAGMEADIRSNPDKYPVLSAMLNGVSYEEATA